MSILSDIEIRELCVLPDKIVDEREYLKLVENTPEPGVYYPDPIYRAQVAATRNEELRRRAMRPPTQEERDAFVPMIEPFVDAQVRQKDLRKLISYGKSSYGYDARLAEDVKIFSNVNATIIDPKRLNDSADQCLIDAVFLDDEDGGRYFILPPNSYALGYTTEHFKMPRNVTAIVLGKSTYARAGLQVNATPIEAGFQGTVVLELANSTSLPMRVYVNEGMAQFLFFKGAVDCEVSYADRSGKYQNQTGITLPCA